MEKNKAFNLTGEQVMAQLTPDEIKGFNLSLPQMTPAAKRFVYLLAQERIQRAALLAACKCAFEFLKDINQGQVQRIQIKSAIEQAGESGE